MVILGRCPECKFFDDLRGEGGIYGCVKCSATWGSWEELERVVRGPIQTEIEVSERRVMLVTPTKDKVPFGDGVVTLLNAALLEHFPGLDLCLAHEGGVESLFPNQAVELHNTRDHIGLERAPQAGEACIDILLWYAYLLEQLFQHGRLGASEGKAYYLNLASTKEASLEARYYLHHAITMCGEPDDITLGDRALRRAVHEFQRPLIGGYITGRILG